jgi:DNA mismatch repair protein MutS
MSTYIEEVNSKANIIEEYFRLYESYSNKYGKSNTILLLQVGSFHEAYQTLTQGFDLQKISDVLNILVSKKNKSIVEVSNKNPYMLGFPSVALSKYLKILIDSGFTVVIGDQVSPPPAPRRAITGVYSPGTYLDDNIPDANNILSIYIEEIVSDNIIQNQNKLLQLGTNSKPNLIVGLSVIDLTTGKSSLHEIYSVKDDEKICLDEAVRFMYANQAREIIITTNNLQQTKLNDIISYLEISDKLYHHQTITQMINTGKKSIFKLSYQQEVLRKVYPNTGLLTPIEYLDLENLSYGRLSFIILLNYAYDHSHNIISKIAKPELYSESKFLNLGNNAMFQLNLFTFDKDNMSNIYSDKTQFKSLFDVLNKTSTPMGRRMLKQNMAQPLVCIQQINSRYDTITQLIDQNKWLEIEQRLIGINDIERLSRKIDLNVINPNDFATWIDSMNTSIELFNYMLVSDIKIENFDTQLILMKLNMMLAHIAKYIDIDELSKYLLNDIKGSIFRMGIFPDIDRLTNKIAKCENYMDAMSWGLSNFLDNYLKTPHSKTDTNLIKIDSNERDGHFLILTKRRAEVLEQLLQKNNTINFSFADLEYVVKKEDLQFKHLPKGNNSKIFIKEMEKNSTRMLEYQDELKLIQKEYFIKFLAKLSSKYGVLIMTIHNMISTIDFLKAGAKVAVKYHYQIPTITSYNIESQNLSNQMLTKSYFIAKELRHPIIELLNMDREYIPTDIELGTSKQDGILLFGLNSAGKSSLQKSIGIAIIMAQMGFPVAAKNFTYYPYQSLFTRISSNDNIFKGLSSFALEISELRSIIKRSNSSTLVIADEVCRGSEHQSSLIIVQTMLEILSKNKVSFITATHLHDIVNNQRLVKLSNVKLYHLHIDYDEILNTITYDRVLKEGSGCNFYGLNIAKHLIADDTFIKLANEVKKEMFSVPDLVNNKLSNYNSDLYMDHCKICKHQPKQGEIPLETHHIVFQKDFKNGINEEKFHLKKNQKSNLVVLCTKCHDLIDSNVIQINGWIQTNNGNELDWFTLKNNDMCIKSC